MRYSAAFLLSTARPIRPALKQLKRTPFPAQQLAIMGIVKRWQEARCAAAVAECGTGKTLISLGSVITHANGRQFTALAMLPPQLVLKWAREASRRLFEVAEQQQGFFTTKQAKAAGFAENTHPYHVQVGNWTREHRGIYRLALFPTTDRPELVLWALWSRNRNEEVEGVYSHHTALSLYDLSDLNPSKLHMTVPTDFRRNSDIPGILVLHYADLPESDVQTAQGFKFTLPLRAILDLIEAGTVERNFIRQALRQAVNRGLVTRPQVRNARMSGPARKFVEEVLRRAA